MELISEIDNILSGSVRMDTEQLKAIAVSETTIKPAENGIVPLSKQSAMKIEKVEPPKLPENEIVDTLEEDPIEVAPLETLDGFDFSTDEEVEEEKKEESQAEESPVKEEDIEISLPETEEVLVQEPSNVSDELFVNNDNDKIEEDNAIETEKKLPKLDDSVDKAPKLSKKVESNEIKEKKINENRNDILTKEVEKLIYDIENRIEDFKKNILNNINKNSSVSETKDESNLNFNVEDEELAVPSLDDEESNSNDLMEEATDQINNIKIPSIDDETTEELPSVDDTKIKGMFI